MVLSDCSGLPRTRPQGRGALPPPRNIDRALAMANAGIPVFPLKIDKRPFVLAGIFEQGSHDATTDATRIAAGFKAYRGALVGWSPGAVGLIAVDVDHKGGTAPGLKNWQKLVADLQINMMGVPLIRTPSGGMHVIWRKPDGATFGNGNRLPEGIDVRADGGYLACGEMPDGSRYRPVDGTQTLISAFKGGVIPMLPEVLLPFLRPLGDDERNAAGSPPASNIYHLPLPPNSQSAEAKLEALIRTVANAKEGERNALTFWGACRMAEMVLDQAIDREIAFKLAVEAGAYSGLPRHEAQRTVSSAFAKVSA
jgi:hypothetical protein